MNDKVLLNLDFCDDSKIDISSSIGKELNEAYKEKKNLVEMLNETIEKIRLLKPDCDKTDYMLAASSGAICGIIDIFLVGKPGESVLTNSVDKWYENRTKDFAKMFGWNGGNNGDIKSAIRFLEQKFKVPYDQTNFGKAFSENYLSPKNHHFKSLCHNFSLLGLFCSIMSQFDNVSYFITETAFSGGKPSLFIVDNQGVFELRGNNLIGKIFSGIVNWIGHLVSDVSGSSSSKGRGMGIPSPFYTWINDIIFIKSKLGKEASNLDKKIYELSLKMFEEGYDIRFQTTQFIPVIINEMLVRFIYLMRRAIKYYIETDKEKFSITNMWKSCEPFSNATVKRMITVAHGVFCTLDITDAIYRMQMSRNQVLEFFLRINVVGIGKFTISLYGEMSRSIKLIGIENKENDLKQRKKIVDGYIENLKKLYEYYDDKKLLDFVDDLAKQDYLTALRKTVDLSEKRGVPDKYIMRNLDDIDKYFS